MTALLEYLDPSISAGRAQLRFGGPSPALGYTNEKQTWRLKALFKFRGMLLYNMPIMPALCPKLVYYASIMLDALACLLCLKLCRHNRRRPIPCTIFYDTHLAIASWRGTDFGKKLSAKIGPPVHYFLYYTIELSH